MIIKNLQKNKGFVILFAVTLSAILLSIALGVANIALKEIKFGTSAKDTNNAFFAADSGIEQVLFAEKSGPADSVNISGLGSDGLSCAIVIITRDSFSLPVKTTIISKGYSNGGGAAKGDCNPGPSAVQREIKVTY